MLDLSEKSCDKLWNELTIEGKQVLRQSAKDQFNLYFWCQVTCLPIYLLFYLGFENSKGAIISLAILQLLNLRRFFKLALWYNDLPRMGKPPTWIDKKIAKLILSINLGKQRNTWYYRLAFKLFGVKNEC